MITRKKTAYYIEQITCAYVETVNRLPERTYEKCFPLSRIFFLSYPNPFKKEVPNNKYVLLQIISRSHGDNFNTFNFSMQILQSKFKKGYLTLREFKLAD